MFQKPEPVLGVALFYRAFKTPLQIKNHKYLFLELKWIQEHEPFA